MPAWILELGMHIKQVMPITPEWCLYLFVPLIMCIPCVGSIMHVHMPTLQESKGTTFQSRAILHRNPILILSPNHLLQLHHKILGGGTVTMTMFSIQWNSSLASRLVSMLPWQFYSWLKCLINYLLELLVNADLEYLECLFKLNSSSANMMSEPAERSEGWVIYLLSTFCTLLAYFIHCTFPNLISLIS